MAMACPQCKSMRDPRTLPDGQLMCPLCGKARKPSLMEPPDGEFFWDPAAGRWSPEYVPTPTRTIYMCGTCGAQCASSDWDGIEAFNGAHEHLHGASPAKKAIYYITYDVSADPTVYENREAVADDA